MNYLLYLDSNFVLDLFFHRNKLVTLEVKKFIKEHKIHCITSVVTWLEVITTLKDESYFLIEIEKKNNADSILRGRRDKQLSRDSLNNIIHELENFRTDHDFIETLELQKEGSDWLNILELVSNSNLEWADTIHLLTAYYSGATHLITRDTPFRRATEELLAIKNISDFKVATPDELLKEFKNIIENANAYILQENFRVFSLEHPERFIGKVDAKVTIVHFTDLESPFCKQFFLTVFKEINKQYIENGKISFMVLNYPLFKVHLNSQNVSISLGFAAKRNKLLEFIEMVSQTEGQVNNEVLIEIIKKIELNPDEFTNSLVEPKNEEELFIETQIGKLLNLQGAPTNIILPTNKFILGNQPFTEFKKLIDKAIKDSEKI
ncbi:MAG: thioredoxin domain-containing protein [archaeon]|nr:thioredoxin domain-containing protein [archaeon]